MSNTQPPIPKSITIPTFDPPKEKSETVEVPGTPVFYYYGVSVLWCWYLVPLETANEYVENLSMTAYDFGDNMAGVSIVFMNGCALYGEGTPGDVGGTVFNETELNVVAFANARAGDVPDNMSLGEFVLGLDQTKNLGAYRLHVACDDKVAIVIGREVYYEDKFFATYDFSAPNPNRTIPAQIANDWRWSIKAYDGKTSSAPLIYSAEADLRNLTFLPINASEIIDLSYDEKVQRPLGSRRNFFGLHQAATFEPQKNVVKVSFGPGEGEMTEPGRQMREDMMRLVGGRSAVAVQVFQSMPVIAEAVPYYMELP